MCGQHTSVAGGYFVIGDGATFGCHGGLFYMTPTGMGIYENVGGAHLVPFAANSVQDFLSVKLDQPLVITM